MLVGITGGTGAGKSTLCASLVARHPHDVALIELDHFFKPRSANPTYRGMENFDHPDVVDFERLTDVLARVKRGETVTVQPSDRHQVAERKELVTVKPKPIVLVEGFLVLWSEELRRVLATSIFLRAPHELRWQRRVHFKSDTYGQEVALPMHEQYVEPTERYAGHVLDVATLTQIQVLERVEKILQLS